MLLSLRLPAVERRYAAGARAISQPTESRIPILITTGDLGVARDVREVANAALEIGDRFSLSITNLALNKILYFAHGWHLALFEVPLIDSPFEAWEFGPGHPQIYRQLKQFGKQPIKRRLTRIDVETGQDVSMIPNLSSQQYETIERVLIFYGKYSVSRLVQISHEPGAPWDQIWEGSGGKGNPGMIIPDAITKEYYASKLSRRL
jgi:uncharacterized phage-associated protein